MAQRTGCPPPHPRGSGPRSDRSQPGADMGGEPPSQPRMPEKHAIGPPAPQSPRQGWLVDALLAVRGSLRDSVSFRLDSLSNPSQLVLGEGETAQLVVHATFPSRQALRAFVTAFASLGPRGAVVFSDCALDGGQPSGRGGAGRRSSLTVLLPRGWTLRGAATVEDVQLEFTSAFLPSMQSLLGSSGGAGPVRPWIGAEVVLECNAESWLESRREVLSSVASLCLE